MLTNVELLLGRRKCDKVTPQILGLGIVIMQFGNRSEAGQLLAKKLAKYANRSDVSVLALPPLLVKLRGSCS